GAPAAADDAVIPFPRRGIDGFTDRTQQAQSREVVLRRMFVAPLDEGANGGGRSVENVDLVLLDDFPEAIELREIGRALVHDGRRADKKRSVDDVAVTGDPADIGGAPVDVFFS